jgi:thiopeptide-type bacteriocin biosynthesis protein
VAAHPRPMFRSAGTALIRAVAQPSPDLPPWPDLTGSGPEQTLMRVEWLRRVWALTEVAEAIDHASPVLGQKVRALCSAEDPSPRETRRAALSAARYLQRMTGRVTPFGLLAGVAAASFGTSAQLRWATGHQATARAGAEWLAEVITQLEGCLGLLARLPVVANTTVTIRGNRLIVPYQPRADSRGTAAVEVSVRCTAAVRAAMDLARAPIRLEDLAAKIQAEFPAARPALVTAMLTELVACRALITSLHAPGTEPDGLAHLVRELNEAGAAMVAPAAGLAASLNEVRALAERHNRMPAGQRHAVRAALSARMSRLARTRRHPLAVDLLLDAEVALPGEVAREAERAALALTRLSAYPAGTPAWRAYHQRFYERFGLGSLVPLLEVVSDSGIGWPDGYPGTVTAAPRSPLSARDKTLLALAQRAALDGQREAALDEQMIAALELRSEQLRPPPHLELGVRVHAASERALQRGDFRLEIATVSRGAGVLTGRFLSMLPEHDRAALATSLAALPGGDRDTGMAQLSFPPLDPATAHVTRTPQILPTVISLAEHRAPGKQTLSAADLAIGCDGRRMYLAAPGRRQRIEAAGMHALNLLTHTPPLARFVTELCRAQCAQVTPFDWGAAADLPYLPRVRLGRTILSPALWRLEAADLPGAAASWGEWENALAAWRARRRAPHLVHLTEAGQYLPLDLDHAGHRALLRDHLAKARAAVLAEAPDPASNGWCGGRAHEIIVPLTAVQHPAWPPLPQPTAARLIGRDHGHAPAASTTLLASLYGDIHRQDTVLTEHLPGLLARLAQPASWWYIRYRDPAQHLRLRIPLPDPSAFGQAAQTISTWAGELRAIGLLREVTYPTSYPETGRWGSGATWSAAQQVFSADSRALLTQLSLPEKPSRLALAAAHATAIATAFTGSITTGMRWLIGHVPARAPRPVPRAMFEEARRIACPRDNWAALRAAPGGAAIADAWAPRDQALATYRAYFPGPGTHGIAVDDVLGSLIHVSFVRACGIDFDDEAVSMHLARAAALTWAARTTGGRP